MKQPVVAIEDNFEGFFQPRRVINLKGAVRDFKVLCETSPKADDLKLWHIGEMDTDTGEIKAMRPVLLEKGASFVVPNTLDDRRES